MAVDLLFRDICGIEQTRNRMQTMLLQNDRHRTVSSMPRKLMMSYVTKYKNPFVIDRALETRLHNILPHAIMLDEVRKDLTLVQKLGRTVKHIHKGEIH